MNDPGKEVGGKMRLNSSNPRRLELGTFILQIMG